MATLEEIQGKSDGELLEKLYVARDYVARYKEIRSLGGDRRALAGTRDSCRDLIPLLEEEIRRRGLRIPDWVGVTKL